MTPDKFYRLFANTPLAERFKPLDVINHGLTTLMTIYEEMQKLDDQIRPLKIQQDKLLKIADNYFINKK